MIGLHRDQGDAWSLSGLEAVEFATLEWIHWYSHRRLLGPIGYIPPAQKEAHYFSQLLEPAIAA